MNVFCENLGTLKNWENIEDFRHKKSEEGRKQNNLGYERGKRRARFFGHTYNNDGQ